MKETYLMKNIPMAGWQILTVFFTGYLLLMVNVFSVSAQSRIRQTWFDINPSTSNTDNNNPNGSSGGRINHMGSTSTLSRIFAASEWGGLYTSFNQGLTWVKVNSFVPSATWDVKVDPRNGEKIYVTSFYDGRVNGRRRTSLSGISISTNAGASWTNAPLPPGPCATPARQNEPSAWEISINPSNTQMVFVGTNCGLARTFDGGGTWTYVDPSPGNNAEQIYAVVAHGDSIVDVIGDNGHFRSLNAGNTWATAPAGGVGLPGGIASIAVSPTESNVLFATVGQNLFESDDAATWPNSITLPPNNAQGRIPFVKTSQTLTSNQFDLWFGDVSLFRTSGINSTNPGGATRVPLNPAWTNVQNGGHNDVADILFDPRATSGSCPLLFSNDGGVYRNLLTSFPACNSPIWEQPNVTPHATWLFGFDGVQQNPGIHGIYYGLQDNGGFGTINAIEGPGGGIPAWNNNTCCDVGSDAAQSDLILSVEGAFSPGRAFRLFRRGANFSGGGEIPNYPSAGTFGSFKSGREVVRFGNNAFAVQLSDGVYFTNNINNSPISWTALNAPSLPGSGIGGLKVSTVNGPTSIYYYTGSGNPNGIPGQVFRRGLQQGSAWTQLPLPANVGSVTVYDVDPNNGNNLIISGLNNITNTVGMWLTTDYGVNWTSLANLDNLMIGGGAFQNRVVQGPTNFTNFGSYFQPYLVQFNPRNSNTILAGAADAGIFITTNFGGEWRLISSPNNPTSTSPHIARPIGAYFSPTRFNANTSAFDVWIGTQGSGVHKVVIESP